MLKPKLYADFHNADPHGRLRLNCIVSFSQEENCWVATIDWTEIHHASEERAARVGRAPS